MKRILFKLATSGTFGCLLIAVPLASYCATVRFLQRKLSRLKGLEAWKRDMSWVNGPACGLCGGTSARRVYSDHLREWHCEDRKLCETTSQYELMLRNLEGT